MNKMEISMKIKNLVFMFLGVWLFICNCSKLEEGNGIISSSTSLDSAISKYEKYIYKDGVYGGTVRFPLYKEPTSFNPFVEPGNVPFMYEGLVKISGVKLDKRLADRIEVSGDSLTWRFKLRKSILWSDSTSITTEDVLFTYNDALKNCDEKNIFYSLTGEKSILRPYTVSVDANEGIVFKFDRYTEMTKELFAIPLLPKHKYEDMISGSFCDSLSVNTPMDCMVGSGPFILSDYAPFGRIMFVKNKNYYREDYKGQKLPYVDTLEFVMFSDIEEALSIFKEGKLDFFAADGIDMRELKGAKNYRLFKQKVSHNGNMLIINQKSDFYKNIGNDGLEILSQSIPRKMILDSLLNKDGVFDYPLSFWYTLNNHSNHISVSKAQKLFKEKGFKIEGKNQLMLSNATKIDCSLLVSSANGFRKQMADIIADRFENIGIGVNVDKLGVEEFLQKMSEGDWSIVLTSYDEGNTIKSALTFWSDMALDSAGKKELINISKKVNSESWKDSLLGNEIMLTIKKNVPSIFLVRSSRNILTSKRLGNVNPSPFGGFTGDVSRLFVIDEENIDDKKR